MESEISSVGFYFLLKIPFIFNTSYVIIEINDFQNRIHMLFKSSPVISFLKTIFIYHLFKFELKVIARKNRNFSSLYFIPKYTHDSPSK